jgi:hypothetical protein
MDNPILSRRDVEEFTPPGSPRTYTIAPLTVRERMRARAAVIAEGGVYPDQATMYAAMRDVLREAGPADLDDLLAVLDEAQAAPDDQEIMAKAAKIETACQSSPAYTALLARRNRHMAAIPFVFFLYAVRSWSGDSLPPFERRNETVREDLLDAVPEAELVMVGWKAHEMAQPGKGAEGNSVTPSRSSGTPRVTPGRNSRSAAGATSSRAKKSKQIRV